MKILINSGLAEQSLRLPDDKPSCLILTRYLRALKGGAQADLLQLIVFK